MKLVYTKEEIIERKGCYTLKRVNNLSFINNKVISLEDILNSEIPTKDKLYFYFMNSTFKESTILYESSTLIQKRWVGSAWSFYDFYDWVSGAAASVKDRKMILNEIKKFIKTLK